VADTPHPELKRLDDAWARTESGLRENSRFSREGFVPTRGSAETHYALGGLVAVGLVLYAMKEESLLLGILGVAGGMVLVLYGVHVQRNAARYATAKQRYLAEREALLTRLSEGQAVRRQDTP
jgi:hypothetical protein